MAKGAQDEAFLHGNTVLFGSTDNNYIQEEKFLDALKAKMVDGIIYVSSNPATSEKLLENITVPVVFMDRKIKKRENMGSVLVDNFSAMKDVAAYIAGKGCRQPAYITADISISPSKELGKKIPEDIKIMGFDDIYISKYLNPELTTVRQDAYEMGRQAAGMLIRYIDQGMPLTDRILPYEIMERGTPYNMKTFNQFT